jgi:hypothetical protein
MKRHLHIFCLIWLLSALCTTADAASVAVVKEGVHSGLSAQTVLDDSSAIILTFGDERVVISDPPQSLPDSQLLAEEVSPSELFIVRDHRPVARRTGYDTIFSHSGFNLAVVKDPKQLAAVDHVRLRPVTGSQVMIRKAKAVAVAPDPTVQKVVNRLSSTLYQQYLTTLARDIPTRYACTNGQLATRDAISNLFKKFGLATSLMTFTNKCKSTCKSPTGYNVIGVKQGLVRPQEYYLIGAHYDSMSGNPCQTAPGANDNASGMAGLMELARVFSQLKTEASIIFVAFSGEETGLLGSQKYVQTLISSGLKANLKAFVVLDMISYYEKNRSVVIEGSNRTSQQSAVLKRLATYGATYTGLKFEITTDYGDSDHEPFLDKGIAGALLIEADWSKYKYYHTTKDLVGYQNIPFGLEVLRVAAAMLAQEAKIIP